LAKDVKFWGTNSDYDYKEDIDLNSNSDDDYMLEDMDRDDSITEHKPRGQWAQANQLG
jgi:hypothetical protein